MAVRWRLDGTLLCAATTEAHEDDTYIDDRLHYQLAVIERVLIPDENEKTNSIWRWKCNDE